MPRKNRTRNSPGCPAWVCVPDHFADESELVARRKPQTPELLLAAAVLGEAIADLDRGPAGEWTKVYADVRAWVESRRRDYLYSFESICTLFDLDVDSTRDSLLALAPGTLNFRGIHTNSSWNRMEVPRVRLAS